LLTLKDVAPDGSNLTTIGSLPGGIGAAVVNPNVVNSVIFAYAPNGSEFGIYQNSSISASGAIQLVPAQLDSVAMIQLTPDDKTIVFVASQNGSSGLYTVSTAGGSPMYLAPADSASLSPDGSTIVFSQATAAGEAILSIPTSGGGTTALTDGTFFDIDPQFSKDGSMVVFSSDRNASGTGGPIGVCALSLSSHAFTYVTSDPTSAEMGPSFNATGTQISYIVQNGTPGLSGVYVCNADGSNPIQIYASDQIGQSSYWTGSNGRGLGRSFPLFQRLRRRKR
jgi:Tol biopolymer transport system component